MFLRTLLLCKESLLSVRNTLRTARKSCFTVYHHLMIRRKVFDSLNETYIKSKNHLPNWEMVIHNLPGEAYQDLPK